MKENFHFKQLQLHYINNHQKEREIPKDTKALVSVHCNCQTGWVVSCEDIGLEILLILQWVFPCLSKTATTTTTTKNVKFVETFFISHLAALKPNLGYWQEGSLTHSMLITTLFQVRPKANREPCSNVGNNSMTERISEIWAGKLLILNVTCCPTVSLTPKMYQKRLTM